MAFLPFVYTNRLRIEAKYFADEIISRKFLFWGDDWSFLWSEIFQFRRAVDGGDAECNRFMKATGGSSTVMLPDDRRLPACAYNYSKISQLIKIKWKKKSQLRNSGSLVLAAGETRRGNGPRRVSKFKHFHLRKSRLAKDLPPASDSLLLLKKRISAEQRNVGYEKCLTRNTRSAFHAHDVTQ